MTPTSPNLPEPATCEDCLTVSAVISERGLKRLAEGKAHCVHAYAKIVDEDDVALVRLSDAQLLAAEVERLRAAVAALRAQIPAPPTPPGPTFWFMRDNHTFRKLAGTPEEMVAQCMEEFDAGWTYGGLFAKNLPSKSFGVHASGLAAREDFRVNALAALDASRLALKEAS